MASGSNDIDNSQSAIISALSHTGAYPHSVDDLQLIETHISWVFLTGHYAYKIKKSVNFGFLDFSTLEKRQRFCEEELRLNRRLAPALYLDVVPIYGPPAKATLKASLKGKGEAIDYAVKMLQFDVKNTFDNLLLCNKLSPGHISETAEVLAGFHVKINIADENTPFGTAESILQPAIENFDQLSASLQTIKNQHTSDGALKKLHDWTTKNHEALTSTFNARKRAGFIRECHGDLHLRNITLWDDHVTPFDCIEFNDNLRWIDVISELAFLLMDLDDHQQPAFSRQLLNRYLSLTGDYDGLEVLRYYQVYRAMVRAKVAGLRLGQSEDEIPEQLKEISNYLHLAECYTKPHAPTLLITHGLSGSGKTYLAKKLSLAADLIHLRSDVERKRCFGLDETAKTQSDHNAGIYSVEETKKIYKHLLRLIQPIINAGFSVLVDATFLLREHRDLFKTLADELNIPFTILHCEASDITLRQRLQERQEEGTDASEANVQILIQQQKREHTLGKDEACYAQTIRPQDTTDITRILSTLRLAENNLIAKSN